MLAGRSRRAARAARSAVGMLGRAAAARAARAAAARRAGLTSGDANTTASALAAEGGIGCDGRATVFRKESAAHVQTTTGPATAGATIARPALRSAVTALAAAANCTTCAAALRAGCPVAASTAGAAIAAPAGAAAYATRPADRRIGRDGTARVEHNRSAAGNVNATAAAPPSGGAVAGIATCATVAAGLAGLALRSGPTPSGRAAGPTAPPLPPAPPAAMLASMVAPRLTCTVPLGKNNAPPAPSPPGAPAPPLPATKFPTKPARPPAPPGAARGPARRWCQVRHRSGARACRPRRTFVGDRDRSRRLACGRRVPECAAAPSRIARGVRRYRAGRRIGASALVRWRPCRNTAMQRSLFLRRELRCDLEKIGAPAVRCGGFGDCGEYEFCA